MLGFSQSIEAVTISKEENQNYMTPFCISEIPLHPQSFFLHSNFVDYSSLGHTLGRVLKIIPIPETSRTQYVYMNFENLEFVPVVFSELQTLSFQLRSHSGKLVTFMNDGSAEFYVNLVFSKKIR